jgi:hypothetical protein
MRQREAKLPKGGRHAEGEGGEDEGRGKGGDRDPEDERGTSLTFKLDNLTRKRLCDVITKKRLSYRFLKITS